MVVVDADGWVLMIEGFDPRHPEAPHWYTVGGGLEAGESGEVVYPLGLEQLVHTVREADPTSS